MTSDPEMYSADTYVALDPDSVLMGLLGGLFPAWRAVRTNVVDAIVYE